MGLNVDVSGFQRRLEHDVMLEFRIPVDRSLYILKHRDTGTCWEESCGEEWVHAKFFGENYTVWSWR